MAELLLVVKDASRARKGNVSRNGFELIGIYFLLLERLSYEKNCQSFLSALSMILIASQAMAIVVDDFSGDLRRLCQKCCFDQ